LRELKTAKNHKKLGKFKVEKLGKKQSEGFSMFLVCLKIPLSTNYDVGQNVRSVPSVKNSAGQNCRRSISVVSLCGRMKSEIQGNMK
jgi:hypothetical protein